ncbi:transposase [Streptomyces rochei]|uniref:transposase n=1 Tax=Streptomyces rochei TaxID=1928 RepID=UPI00362EC4CF
MSDAEWAVVKNLLPVPGWLAGRGGRPEGFCHRPMIDAVRYVVDNGTRWRADAVRLSALAAGLCTLRPMAGHRAGGRTA